MTRIDEEDLGVHNEVRLTGRISSAPVERELPSGDAVLSFRLVVPRSRTPMTAGSKQASDWVDCAVWGGRMRRAASSWQVGDRVEVKGALRRRFFRQRGGAGGVGLAGTRVEVEVLAGRRLRRSPDPVRRRGGPA